MTQDDVGAFYAHDDGSVWTLVGYSAAPTATLERVFPVPLTEAILGQRVRRDGVVGTPIFDGFTRLVLDGGDGEQVARCAYPGCRNEEVELVGLVRIGRDEDLAHENVFACPFHERWLRNDAGEYLAPIGALNLEVP